MNRCNMSICYVRHLSPSVREKEKAPVIFMTRYDKSYFLTLPGMDGEHQRLPPCHCVGLVPWFSLLRARWAHAPQIGMDAWSCCGTGPRMP